MLESLILFYFLIFSSVGICSGTPCWCDSLHARVHKSTLKLIDRYGLAALKEASTFSSSGVDNALSKRLFESLEQKKPFRIGVLGGSYACPVYDGNNWSANVSRWLNEMLSTSECHEAQPSHLSDESACSAETDVPHQICDEVSYWARQPSLFCAQLSGVDYTLPSSVIAENVLLRQQGRELHPSGRPIGHICDNSQKPVRVCSVYQGSGKYCTITHGAKGAMNTMQVVYELQSILNPSEPLDAVFWDFSVNDRLMRCCCSACTLTN